MLINCSQEAAGSMLDCIGIRKAISNPDSFQKYHCNHRHLSWQFAWRYQSSCQISRSKRRARSSDSAVCYL